MDLLTISITAIVSLFVVFSTIYPESFGGEGTAAAAGIALTYAIQVW